MENGKGRAGREGKPAEGQPMISRTMRRISSLLRPEASGRAGREGVEARAAGKGSLAREWYCTYAAQRHFGERVDVFPARSVAGIFSPTLGQMLAHSSSSTATSLPGD